MRVKRLGITLGSIVTIVLALVLSFEALIKWGIGAVGNMVGVKIVVEDVDFSLKHATLELKKMDIYQPDQPTYVAQIDAIVVDFQWKPMVQGALIVDDVAVENMAMLTPRLVAKSAATAPASSASVNTAFGRAQTPKKESAIKAKITSYIDSLNLDDLIETPDLSDRIDLEQTQIAKQAAALQTHDLIPTADKAEFEARWAKIEARGQALGDMSGLSIKSIDDLSKIKTRIDEANGVIKDANQLQRDIQAAIAKSSTGYKQQLAQIKDLDKLIDADVQAIKSQLNIGDLESGNFANLLPNEFLSDMAKHWLEKIAAITGRTASGEKIKTDRQGKTITFIPNPYPGLWVKQVRFMGSSSGQSITGVIADISDDQHIVGGPATMRLTLTNVGITPLLTDVTGQFDTRPAGGKHTVRLDIANLRVPQVDIATFSDRTLRVDSGAGRLGMDISLTGPQLVATMVGDVSQLKSNAYQFRGNGLSTESFIANLIDRMKRLEIRADIAGTAENVDVSVSSNVDKMISEQLGILLKLQSAKLESDIRKQLNGLVDEKQADLKKSAKQAFDEQVAPLKEQDDQAGGLTKELDKVKSGLSGKSNPQKLFGF